MKQALHILQVGNGSSELMKQTAAARSLVGCQPPRLANEQADGISDLIYIDTACLA